MPGKGWRYRRSNWYSLWLISFELQLQNKFNIAPKSHALFSNMTQTDKKRKPWYSCLRDLSLDSWYLNVTNSVMTIITLWLHKKHLNSNVTLHVVCTGLNFLAILNYSSFMTVENMFQLNCRCYPASHEWWTFSDFM